MKVAVDFILPESLPQAFKFAQEFRQMAKAEATETNHLGETVAVAPADRHSQDKLQAELSMCLAAMHAVELLQTQQAAVTQTKGRLARIQGGLLAWEAEPGGRLQAQLCTCLALTFVLKCFKLQPIMKRTKHRHWAQTRASYDAWPEAHVWGQQRLHDTFVPFPKCISCTNSCFVCRIQKAAEHKKACCTCSLRCSNV